ncbi:helix-turn-helix domain-containing protein [Bacteroides xylanisolvens]|jgi:DNA-binding CsgD family transcriptional regulator|uniref:helix-turn-helix domain-containing protein n=1 Tax=Bacteroides xylanisolvens TaxID=371601 RepID=UPI001C8C5839|nr:LuxR C-terminal-related transcriptional regulator [Bacteroides xylanisolvens]
MKPLSERERQVAVEYCKGLADKEVADNLKRSVWTIKAQKRDIYKKLGINKDTELVLYMLCDRLKVNFDLKEIRKHGIEILFSILFVLMQVTCNSIDMRRMKSSSRVRTTMSCRVGLGRKNSDLQLSIMGC